MLLGGKNKHGVGTSQDLVVTLSKRILTNQPKPLTVDIGSFQHY
ncbi:jg2461, partial [Pararge aegeria aegeria]